MPDPNPVRDFQHTHGHLHKLTFDIGRLLREQATADFEELTDQLELLRHELLEHFAQEEEVLFPFIRASVPEKRTTIDQLEAGHDAICSAIVHLAQIASRAQPDSGALVASYERFEEVYSRHSREEAALLMELGGTLTESQQWELLEIVRELGYSDH